MNLFITSDKQGSGKTLIAAGIGATMQSLGYSVGYYKPIQINAVSQNGFPASPDISFVKKADPNLKTQTSYIFKTDALPVFAGQKENNPVKAEVLVKDYLKLRKSVDMVLVEGCGGVLTPYTKEMKAADFIIATKTPMIMVVEPKNDNFDDVVANLLVAKHSGIEIRGVIVNKYTKSSKINIKKMPALIEAYSGIPVVGIVEKQEKLTPTGLIDIILHSVDLDPIFNRKVPNRNSQGET